MTELEKATKDLRKIISFRICICFLMQSTFQANNEEERLKLGLSIATTSFSARLPMVL